MPNARQLLEQADALMRRNRKRSKGKGAGPPTLTDALGIDATGTLAPTIILAEASPQAADPIELGALPRTDGIAATPAPADPIALDTLSDLPVLTDIVDAWPAQPAQEWPPLAAELAAEAEARTLDDALEADALAIPATISGIEDAVESAPPVDSVIATAFARHEATTGHAHAETPLVTAPAAVDPAPATPAQADDAPLLVHDEEFILDIPPAPDVDVPTGTRGVTPAAVAAAPVPMLEPGSPAWEAMTEEIRMQVLQRLDLFTDTGMRDQLGARLQPIVARASAELVETINQALGELVRGYVAEAIEREIETWRRRGG
jgi:hypothetical protein